MTRLQDDEPWEIEAYAMQGDLLKKFGDIQYEQGRRRHIRIFIRVMIRFMSKLVILKMG